MQILTVVVVDTLSNIDIEAEVTIFLCSVIAFFMLISVRNRKPSKSKRTFDESQDPVNKWNKEDHDDKYYVQTDKALRAAFEKEDYWQGLRCWNELKYFDQSSIHLSMIIRAMRFCNKGAYFIVTELKNFFKAHPQTRSIGLINELLTPLARSSDDAQLVDLLVRMIPTINLVKDSRTYEILLTMYATNGNLSKAQSVIAEMKAKDLTLTARATVAIMTVGLQTGDVDVVLKAFNELKASWDERDTWAVSIFALNGHKTHILKQIVALACQTQQVCALSLALDGMAIPEEVLETMQGKFSLLSDEELSTTIAALKNTDEDLETNVIYNMLLGCSSSRAKLTSLPPWKTKKLGHAFSNASTSEGSEGSRSDNEEDSLTTTQSLPPWRMRRGAPGLTAPPGF